MQNPAPPDASALKQRLKATWDAGDYSTFATYMEPGAREVWEGWRVPAGSRMLDVGCGAGQLGIPAARAGVQVTGVDISPHQISAARARAAAEGLSARFEEADVEDLPFGDGEFDVVVSTFGAMFAPRPERAASEMLRVTRSGGRILMANWTGRGFVASFFKVVVGYLPPPPGMPSPLLWGDEETVRQRFGSGAARLELTRRPFPQWKYPFGVAETVEHYRRYYGPVNRAFAALDEARQASLRRDLEEVFSKYNAAGDGTMQPDAEFLDVQAVRA